MDAKKFSEKQIKVVGTTKVEPIQVNHIDPQYKLIPHSNSPATPTAWVIVARLVPCDTKLPTFVMRWDHDKEELDIDIDRGGKDRKDLWEENGYKGHKTTLIDGRGYYVEIIIPPRRTVFEGIVRAGLLVGLNLHENISVSDHAAVEIKEPSSDL